MDQAVVTPWARALFRARRFACFSLLLAPISGFAQGSFQSLNLLVADGSVPLHSQSLSLGVPAPGPNPLEFRFGFETDEAFSPGQFFDSFTLSLRTVDDLFTLILVTADASGVVFAPLTPGTQFLPESSIARTPIAAPSLSPNLVLQHSFSVRTLLPDSLLGREVTLMLDLFDNGNGVKSQGWISDLVLVPEPACWPLFPLVGLVLFLKRSRKH